MGEFCGNCFYEKPTAGVCPSCGYDPAKDAGKHPMALRTSTILNGRYIIGRVLGQGGFGITYAALDYPTRNRVAIKEYLPTDFAGRTQGTNAVQVHSEEMRENFDYGKEQFLAEAKTLAEFIGSEHIVRIYSYFEENNTAYFAMEYINGVSLNNYMRERGGRLSVEEANELLIPVMEALDWVHSKGIVHRDIAPDNIIITKDGAAKLIDFGAARYSTGEKSKSLDVILKHGFAPKEQYSRRSRQGPFTDVYAMGATYYYAITGKVPTDSIDRMDDDDLIDPSSIGVEINGQTEDVLLKALEVSASERYQHMGEFAAALQAVASQESAPPVYQPVYKPVQPVYPSVQPVQPVYQSVPPVLQENYVQPAQPIYPSAQPVQYVQPEEPPVQYAQSEEPVQPEEPSGYEWQSEEIPVVSSKKNTRKRKDIFTFFALVALAAVVLLVCFFSQGGSKKTPAEPVQTAAVTVNYIACFDNEAVYENDGRYSGTALWGNAEHDRTEVTKVTFQNTKDGAPNDAWDISEAKDGRVIAWLHGTKLYVAADGMITVRSAKSLFSYFENVTEIDFGGCFSTAETTDMSFMFDRCSSLTALDVSGFDTSKVTDMGGMFFSCCSLTALDVSGFDTSNVTDMYAMFTNCIALTALDVSGFDTSKVTDMSWMFYGCKSLTTLDVSGFDTSNVTDMGHMFSWCSALTTLDVSGWDVSRVTEWADFMDEGRTVNGRPWEELFEK